MQLKMGRHKLDKSDTNKILGDFNKSKEVSKEKKAFIQEAKVAKKRLFDK
ncbi:hypothetical protein LC040_02155 [Bacillus tianshenii]|nr:hypothetical protein LC040_02155 [Bacillus tianshenii]